MCTDFYRVLLFIRFLPVQNIQTFSDIVQ